MDFVASDGAPYNVLHPFTQSYPGDPTLPVPERPSLSYINPSMLMGGDYVTYPEQDPSPISPYTSGNNHYQRVPTVPPISTEVWMGYSDEASAPGDSPISMMGRGDPYITFTQICVCGCDKGACVPQREYERPRTDPLSPAELGETIEFRVNGVCGYPLKDALKKQYTGLDGRDDKMFVTCKSSISIRLEWLPYEKWTRQIRTLTWRKDQDHITRAKLATEVAKRMDAFFKEMQGKDVAPSYREHRVQPGDLDRMELVALKRVSKSSWMPHLRPINPPQPH